MTTHSNTSQGLTNSYNRAKFARRALVAAITTVSLSAYADQSITAMSVTQPDVATTQLRLDFDGLPVTPEAYQLDNPPRLVLDFKNIENGLPNRQNTMNQGVISNVTTLSGDETTRLIVGLNDVANPSVNTQFAGDALLVNIVDPNATAPATMVASNTVITESPITSQQAYVADTVITPEPVYVQEPVVINDPVIIAENSARPDPVVAVQPPPEEMVVRVNPLLNPAYATPTRVSASYAGLTSVNYSGNAQSGNISIGIANESIPVDIQRQGNSIVVRMTGATVPSNLVQQQNVSGGLVSSVSARNNGRNGVVTIDMADDFEYQAYQSGTQVNISVKPPELLREPTLEEKVYTGEPLSVDFQNVEVRSVLHLISQFTEMNIVASDGVQGNITLNLINVPWDQALDIILKSKNLGMRANGNVILVAPATELAEQEAAELEAQQRVDTFLPLRTEYIRLSYAIAEDVLTLISQGRSSNTGVDRNRDSGSLLSERGTVTVDERTNTLIVKDTSDSIENIRELIAQIDIPVKQVMIEARIVSATDSFSKELGVKWGILSNGAANNRDLLVGGSNQTLWDLKEFDVESTTVNGQTVNYPSYDITRPDNLNVDLGVANPAGRIAFGLLSMSDLMIDLELSALQADGRGEVISTPKVLTTDKQTARVSSGTQIPYQEAAASGATSTSFVEAGLILEATPNITPDGKIGLELNIENGTPSFATGGSVAIARDALTTNVIMEDGQTIVLGGIFRNQINNNVEKVPFLGDLPYLGRMFRSDVRSNDKQELLIFVTPKVINDGVTRYN